MKAYQVIYSGQVQGVFFRASALEISGKYAISGYIKNQMDDTVELVVEGREEEVQDFLAEVKKAKEQYIQNIKITVIEPGGYAEFSIRH